MPRRWSQCVLTRRVPGAGKAIDQIVESRLFANLLQRNRVGCDRFDHLREPASLAA